MLDGYRGLKALVTGGAGFIGSHLVDELLSLGAQVRVLDDLSTGSLGNLGTAIEHVDFREGSIEDPDFCLQAADGMDVVFHQAALGSVPRSMKHPAASVAVNVTGTANVFSAARDHDVRRVVYASSSSVYGNGETLPKREGDEGVPLSPYALTKHMNEELAFNFASCFGMELLGLRYFNVYGPRQSPEGPYAAVIPLFVRAIMAGRSPVIHGDGEQSRDFTFVKDAVQANLRAGLSKGVPSEESVVNIGAGARTDVNALAHALLSVAGRADLSPEHVEARAGDVRHSHADIARARRLLQYEPKVPLMEGIETTWRWWREHLRGD